MARTGMAPRKRKAAQQPKLEEVTDQPVKVTSSRKGDLAHAKHEDKATASKAEPKLLTDGGAAKEEPDPPSHARRRKGDVSSAEAGGNDGQQGQEKQEGRKAATSSSQRGISEAGIWYGCQFLCTASYICSRRH